MNLQLLTTIEKTNRGVQIATDFAKTHQLPDGFARAMIFEDRVELTVWIPQDAELRRGTISAAMQAFGSEGWSTAEEYERLNWVKTVDGVKIVLQGVEEVSREGGPVSATKIQQALAA